MIFKKQDWDIQSWREHNGTNHCEPYFTHYEYDSREREYDDITPLTYTQTGRNLKEFC